MAESILLFSPQSSLLSRAGRKTKVWYHLLGMWLAGICAIVGWLAIYSNKERTDAPHGATNHGRIGFITVLYTTMQCFGGMALYFPSISMKFVKYSKLKVMHATSGTLLFTMACGSLVLGMCSNWFTGQVTGTSWYACVTCPLLLTLIVWTQVTSHYVFKKQPPAADSVQQ